MTNLSERVMSLSGPDREVDAEIAPLLRLRIVNEGHPIGRVCYDQNSHAVPLPAFTGSIDAAMTLVPEGEPAFSATFWRLGNDGEGADPAEFKAEILLCSMLTSKRLSATASTPALALCAAALLAREASNGDL